MKMAFSDAVDSSPPESNKSDKKVGSKAKLAYLAELLLVFALALHAYGMQAFVFAPKLSLLFDSQGYVFTAQACSKALTPENLRDIFAYFAGGCHDDILRTAIVSHMPGVLELVKSGPLLPAILVLSSIASHGIIDVAHWNVGASAMQILMALGVVGMTLWARALGGPFAGRIAAVLAITYSGFSVNADRILSEIPATAIVPFALYTVYELAKFTEQSSSRINRAEVLIAACAGLAAGLLMLSRPTFLPWPFIAGFCLLVYSLMSKRSKIFHPAILLSFTMAAALCLAPWAMARQILSGSPSIVIERNGPLNLSKGLDLRTDGFDALPSPLVTHPEEFKVSTGEVIHQLFREFRERPAAFFHLLLRKPARLLDSPWNDFQTKNLGFIPLLVQRFHHQLILLCALLGVVLLLEHGRKRPDYLLLLSGLLMALFFVFHMVPCVFISMSRYFITAMPVAIVAAAYFIAYMCKQGKRALPACLALLCAPLVSIFLYYELVPGYGRLSDLSVDFGLVQVSITAAVIMTAAFAVSVLQPAFTIFSGFRSKIVLSSFTLVAGFSLFVTVAYQFMCSEAVVRLGSVDHENMTASVNIPPGTMCKRWYLLLDANDTSNHGASPGNASILKDMKVQLNGREFKPDWLPLLSMDTSMREESMFLAAFAYSCGKRCTDFRQWIGAPLPAETVSNPGENQIVFSVDSKQKSHPKIFADFTDSFLKPVHTVSLRDFSWTKGFFVDCPGEMRLDVWPHSAEKQNIFDLSALANKRKPRAFLLGVIDETPSESWVRVLDIPPQEISDSNRVANFELKKLPDAIVAPTGARQSLRIRVSGELRSADQNAGPSVCLLEGFKQGDSSSIEYAPLSPETLPASGEWSEFSFEDMIEPVRYSGSYGKPFAEAQKLSNLRLQFAQRPWWEVLDYGLYKGSGTVEFRKLRIEFCGVPGLNLSRERYQIFDLQSQFTSR